MASSSLATDDFDQYFASLEPSTAGFMDHDWLSLRETLPLDIASTSEPVLGDGDLPIPIAWLMSHENWPEAAEHILRTFMTEHGFYNYYSTKATSKQQLATVTKELRKLFDAKDWEERVHDELLKSKVRRKIHRIRREIQRDHLNDFRNALAELDPVQYPTALQFVMETVGPDLMRTMLDAAADGH